MENVTLAANTMSNMKYIEDNLATYKTRLSESLGNVSIYQDPNDSFERVVYVANCFSMY